MARNERTSSKSAKAASKVLRDDRSGKHAKTAAGSALSQRPVTKRASITEAQASKAVRTYLSDRNK
jgi:hypothetical protein